MKRGLVIILAIFLFFTTAVAAQEFSVRFYSFGKNATLDLKAYLGESQQYVVSQTENVIVRIEQSKGIAYLSAKPGWEGSEILYFRTIESQPTIEEAEEMVKRIEEEEEKPIITPLAPETMKEKAIVWGSNIRLFGGTIDSSVLELFESITKREEIKKLTKKVDENGMQININDEVDLDFQTGYIPKASMNLSLIPKLEEVTEPVEEEKEGLFKTRGTLIIVIIANVFSLLLIIVAIYLYIMHPRRKAQKIEVGGWRASKISQLERLQESFDASSSEEFLSIMRGFFSRYFGIPGDFEFEDLRKTVEKSDIHASMKRRIFGFIKSLSKWTSAQGVGRIPERELKSFIRRLKNIIRHI